MRIVFDRPVRPITNATLLEEGEVLVEDEPMPMLEINAIPGEFTNKDKLSFNWEMINSTSKELTI